MNTKINLSGSYRSVSGARYYLILNPEDGCVSDYLSCLLAAIGSAVPFQVWHKRWIAIPLCADVVQSELRKELTDEGTLAIIEGILDLYQGPVPAADGLRWVGRWPTDEWGAPTDEMEGLVHQLTEILKQVPSYIEASDLFEWGGMDWFLFHDYDTTLDTMVQTLVDEARHDGFFIEASDLHEVLKSWLQEAVSDLELDDDRSDEEQKNLALGRWLLAGVA